MDQKMVERLFPEYNTVRLVRAYGPRKGIVHLAKWSGMRREEGQCATCGSYRMGTCADGCDDRIYYTSVCEVSISKTGNFRFCWL